MRVNFLNISITDVRSFDNALTGRSKKQKQTKKVLPVVIARRHWSDATISTAATRASVGWMAMTAKRRATAGPIIMEPTVRTNTTSAFCQGRNVSTVANVSTRWTAILAPARHSGKLTPYVQHYYYSLPQKKDLVKACSLISR